MYEARRRQTTEIKKRGLLLDLNCLPSQVARLIVRGFNRGRILLFPLDLSSFFLFPLYSSFSHFLFSSFFMTTRSLRFHKPRLGTLRSHTFRFCGTQVFSTHLSTQSASVSCARNYAWRTVHFASLHYSRLSLAKSFSSFLFLQFFFSRFLLMDLAPFSLSFLAFIILYFV